MSLSRARLRSRARIRNTVTFRIATVTKERHGAASRYCFLLKWQNCQPSWGFGSEAPPSNGERLRNHVFGRGSRFPRAWESRMMNGINLFCSLFRTSSRKCTLTIEVHPNLRQQWARRLLPPSPVLSRPARVPVPIRYRELVYFKLYFSGFSVEHTIPRLSARINTRKKATGKERVIIAASELLRHF